MVSVYRRKVQLQNEVLIPPCLQPRQCVRTFHTALQTTARTSQTTSRIFLSNKSPSSSFWMALTDQDCWSRACKCKTPPGASKQRRGRKNPLPSLPLTLPIFHFHSPLSSLSNQKVLFTQRRLRESNSCSTAHDRPKYPKPNQLNITDLNKKLGTVLTGLSQSDHSRYYPQRPTPFSTASNG